MEEKGGCYGVIEIWTTQTLTAHPERSSARRILISEPVFDRLKYLSIGLRFRI